MRVPLIHSCLNIVLLVTGIQAKVTDIRLTILNYQKCVTMSHTHTHTYTHTHARARAQTLKHHILYIRVMGKRKKVRKKERQRKKEIDLQRDTEQISFFTQGIRL